MDHFQQRLHTLGQRVHVFGSSSCGKTTLAAELAALLAADFVDLDALNWEPNWYGLNEHDPDELDRRIAAATGGERWVVAGSYSEFSQRGFWPRLDTIVWLDLPLGTLVWRMLRRSWRRWRSQELLWGTNREQFWPQLAVWRKEQSLLWWIVAHYQRKRINTLETLTDPRWAHIRVIRLVSAKEVSQFRTAVGLAPFARR